MNKYLLTILLVLLSASPCFAATHYIRDNAAGAKNGTSWPDAWEDMGDFAWSTDVARGDTVYVADGTYLGDTFDTAESGSTYIYIKKATESVNSGDAGWNSTYGDGQAEFTSSASGAVWYFTTGYWDVSGIARTNWTSGYGIKISCTNTSAGSQLAKLGTTGGAHPDYIIFRYAEFYQSGLDLKIANDGIYAIGDSENDGPQNVTVQYCYLHNSSRELLITQYTRYWTVEYNYISDTQWTSLYETQQCSAWAMKGCDDGIIRYNKFVDIPGTSIVSFKSNLAWVADGWDIYGNLFYHTDGFNKGNLGMGSTALSGTGSLGVTNCKYYNNTHYNMTYFHAPGSMTTSHQLYDPGQSAGNVAYNNLWYKCNINTAGVLTNYSGVGTADYTWYYDTQQYNSPASDNAATLAARDTNGQLGTADPFTNSSTYDLTLSAATDGGYTLSSPYNMDMNGNTRGGDGTWDRGAYEFGVGSAALTGTLSNNATEKEIVDGGETLIITLTDATWHPNIGIYDTSTTALISGLTSAQSEAGGWNAKVRTNMSEGEITRDSDTQVTILLTAESTYAITANETITVTIPTEALTAGGSFAATPTFDVIASNPAAVLTGTLADDATEAQIIAGGETLIITLTDDTWVATIGDDNAFTTALIAGIDSGGTEGAGWDAEVKGNMVYTDVTRTSATVVTITLGAEASYAVTTNETITATIPANALTGAVQIIATPTFDIIATNPAAVMTGTLSDNATEAQIVNGGETLIITLTDDTWDADIGSDSAETTALIAGIDSNGIEATGWDAVVKGNMDFNDISRDSDTQVTVTLGAEAAYDISGNEGVTVTIPTTAVASATQLVATPDFNIIFFETTTEETVGMTLQ